uniref:PAP-associated domain-containing protein n=2 Tax=Octactis speculum TaxID=3111310 RepID=A0A7S2DT69_9STRA
MVSNLDQVAEQLRSSGVVNLHLVPAAMPVLKFTDAPQGSVTGSNGSSSHGDGNALRGQDRALAGRDSPDNVIRFGDFSNDDSGDESVVSLNSDTGSMRSTESSRSSASFTSSLSSSSSECSSSSSMTSEYAGPPLMVDVTCMGKNHHGLRAVRFVADALTTHPTLRPLVLVLKQLLNVNGLMDPITGGLTSHVVVLMALAFLVHGPSWPAFPDTKKKTKKTAGVGQCPSKQQSSTADRRVDENEGKHARRNCSEDGEPLVGEAGGALLAFLEHYSRFDYEHWGVSTTRGFFLRGQHEGAGDLGDLFVEDPFGFPRRRNNVAQSVYRVSQLKALFAATLRDLTCTNERAVSERQVEGSSTTCKPTCPWSAPEACKADGRSRSWTISSEALLQRLGSSVCWQPVAGKTPQASPSIGQPHPVPQVTTRPPSPPAHPAEPLMRTAANMKTKRNRRRGPRSTIRPTPSSQPISSFQPAQPSQLSQPMQPPQTAQASPQILQTQQPGSQKPSSVVHSVPIISAPLPLQPSTVSIPTPNVSRPPTAPKVKGWGKSTVAHLSPSPRSVVAENEWPALGPSFPALPSSKSGNARTCSSRNNGVRPVGSVGVPFSGTASARSVAWPVRRSVRSQ